MFYSHEVLTSKKYGIATVWLVATIGSQSKLKKVSRKQISDVNVEKACNTVIFPEAPMALRLQGNLLYGVSRVHYQQCSYLLADAQKAQDAMRNLLRATRSSNELDPNAGKARPDQLMLMDDPAFMPEDLKLPALDFDLSDMNFKSQNSSYLSPGPRRRASSDGSSRTSSVLGLRISSSSGKGTYQLLPDDNNDPFAPIGSSAHKLPTLKVNLGGGGGFEDEEMGLDEPDFEFDAEGNEVQVVGSTAPTLTFREKLLSGSAASGAVRLEHEEAEAARALGKAILGEDGDVVNMMMMGEDAEVVGRRPQSSFELDPNAEAFSVASATAKSRGATATEGSLKPSSEKSGGAPQQRAGRSTRAPKFIEMDRTLVHSNREIKAMGDEYLSNMQKVARAKQGRRLITVANNNAMMWVFGDGIGGVGRGIGEGKIPGPLGKMFAGAALMKAVNAIISRPESQITASSPKRGSSPAPDGSDAEARRVRPRLEDNNGDVEEAILARGNDDMMPLGDEEEGIDIEVGREAHDALDDHMSSAMPWNISASARGASSSIHGGTGGRAGFGSGSLRNCGHQLAGSHSQMMMGRGVREGSRMTSASPLINRGRSIVPLDHAHYGGGGSDEFAMAHLAAGSDNLDAGLSTQERSREEEFELYGPAAEVDTQTANKPQWISDALDRESSNFMDYIKTIARENRKRNNLLAKGLKKGSVASGYEEDWVDFNQLIPSRSKEKEVVVFGNSWQVPSVLVAAQGFLHILTLATKGLLRVEQGRGPNGEGVGEIRVWAVGGDDHGDGEDDHGDDQIPQPVSEDEDEDDDLEDRVGSRCSSLHEDSDYYSEDEEEVLEILVDDQADDNHNDNQVEGSGPDDDQTAGGEDDEEHDRMQGGEPFDDFEDTVELSLQEREEEEEDDELAE